MAKSVKNVPVAPRGGEAVGTSTKGQHILDYRAQPAFPVTAKLALVSTVNPWRANSPGHAFYVKVLALKPATVKSAIDLGAKMGLKAGMVQAHLRWLYTWGGAYLSVDGQLYGQAKAAPKARKPAKLAKAA